MVKRSRSDRRHKLGVSWPGHLVAGPVPVAGLEGGGARGCMDQRLGVAGLALVAHCGVEAVIIRHVADSLHPAVREPHGVAAPGDAAVTPLLRPVVVHTAVLVIHTKVIGIRFWLIVLKNRLWMMRQGVNWCWMWERVKRSWAMMNWSRWRRTKGGRSRSRRCRMRPRGCKVRLRSRGQGVNRSKGGEMLDR